MQTEITQIRKNFVELVPFFDEISKTNLHKQLRDHLIKSLDLKDQLLGLEVGAGTGSLSYQICEQYKIIMHCTDALLEMLIQGDISYKHHQIVRSKLNLDTLMPQVRETFDFICGSLIFHLITDKQKLLLGLHKILRPNGKIAFLVPSPKITKEIATSWCHDNNIEGLEKELVHGLTNSALSRNLENEEELKDFFIASQYKDVKFLYGGYRDSLLVICATRNT